MVDLSNCKAREEGFETLKGLKKKELLEIAKAHHVHVNSSDNKNYITLKLVESLVGYKLRYEALLSM